MSADSPPQTTHYVTRLSVAERNGLDLIHADLRRAEACLAMAEAQADRAHREWSRASSERDALRSQVEDLRARGRALTGGGS